MSLSVIVPIYNEERRIARALFELNNYLENHFDDFELIVVDDGSEDETLSILKDLPFASLKVLSIAEHLGRGEAIRIGFSHAHACSAVVLFDADLSVSPTIIGKLMNTLHTTDCPFVFTEPTASFNAYFRRLSPLRFRRMALALLGISHVACGTKRLSSSFARMVIPKTRMNDWGFEPELIFLAQTLGIRPQVLAQTDLVPKKNFSSSVLGVFALLKIRRLAHQGAYQAEKTKEWGGPS